MPAANDTLTSLLIHISAGAVDSVPILADWCEERGYARLARRLRGLSVREYNDGGLSYWYVDDAWPDILGPHQIWLTPHLTPKRAGWALTNHAIQLARAEGLNP